MKLHLTTIAAFASMAVSLAAAPVLTPDKAAAGSKPDGAALYNARCGGCHSIAANRIGPAHKGVFGRKAGTGAGYRYSDALRLSAIVWNDVSLDRWLLNPQQLVRGSKMFVSVPDAAERKAIITYLKSPAAR